MLGGKPRAGGGIVTLDIGAETNVLRDAEALGFTLLQRELDTGQLAWVWLADDGRTQARFLTRPEAITFMTGRLRRIVA